MSYLLLFIILFTLKTITFFYLNSQKTILQSLIDSFVFIPKILVQQIVLLTVWYFLCRNYFTFWNQYIILGFIFAVAHYHLFFKLKRVDALFLTFASWVGGTLFGYLYSSYELGFYVAFFIHLTFHIILDFIFIILKLKPMAQRNGKILK